MFVVTTLNGYIVVINDNYFIQIKGLKRKHNNILKRECRNSEWTENKEKENYFHTGFKNEHQFSDESLLEKY